VIRWLWQSREEMRRLVLVPLGVLLLSASASAAPSKELWATVNICDTPAYPDSMGVRAAMPGNGTHERMYVRFQAQVWSFRSQRWRGLRGMGRSPWLYVGSARFRSQQAGWTFDFDRPEGKAFLVRALAVFEWRERTARHKPQRARWAVVMRRRRATRGGILGVAGGDLPGTSIDNCWIK
jgi:hypothetical protein